MAINSYEMNQQPTAHIHSPFTTLNNTYRIHISKQVEFASRKREWGRERERTTVGGEGLGKTRKANKILIFVRAVSFGIFVICSQRAIFSFFSRLSIQCSHFSALLPHICMCLFDFSYLFKQLAAAKHGILYNLVFSGKKEWNKFVLTTTSQRRARANKTFLL